MHAAELQFLEHTDNSVFHSSASLGLDLLLGSGIPAGSLIEVFGPMGAGKSILCAVIAGAWQTQGYPVAVIDVDRAMNKEHYRWAGAQPLLVDIDATPAAEDVMLLAAELVDSKAPLLLIIDSTTSLTTKAELNKRTSGNMFSRTSWKRMMTQSLTHMRPAIERSGSVVVAINRCSPATLPAYRAPTAHGNALRSHADIRLEIRALAPALQHVDIAIDVIKNQYGASGGSSGLRFLEQHGLCRVTDIFASARRGGLIQCRAADAEQPGYHAGTKYLGSNGASAVIELYRDNALRATLEQQLRHRLTRSMLT